MTILLCFGILFPPLMIIAGFSICGFTYYEEACIGWLLTETRQKGSEYDWVEEEINREYEGVEESGQVTLWSTLIVSCSLYSYIIFDTIGDKQGWLQALPLTLLMFAIPGILLIAILVVRVVRQQGLLQISPKPVVKIEEESKEIEKNNEEDAGGVELMSPSSILLQEKDINTPQEIKNPILDQV